jgi:hypothetical protein
MIHTSYKVSPVYDSQLNSTVLKYFKLAPLLLLSFGFWQLTNYGLLKNPLENISDDTQPDKEQHTWMTYFTSKGISTETGPAVFLYYGFILYAIFLIIKDQLVMIIENYSTWHRVATNVKKVM